MDIVLELLLFAPSNFTFISKDKCALLRNKNINIRNIPISREAIIYPNASKLMRDWQFTRF